jgi:hypothetical protein
VLSVKNGDKSPLPSFIVASWSPLSVLVETFQTVFLRTSVNRVRMLLPFGAIHSRPWVLQNVPHAPALR